MLAWILFALSCVLFVLFFLPLYVRSQNKRNHLCDYAVLLLLSDEIRQEQRAKFIRWVHEDRAENAMALSSDAVFAVERVADGLASSAGLAAHAALWKEKNNAP